MRSIFWILKHGDISPTLKLECIKTVIVGAFGKTGVSLKTFDEAGKIQKLDLQDIMPGMFVRRYDGTVLQVRGAVYFYGDEEWVPCSDGYVYSPLLLC